MKLEDIGFYTLNNERAANASTTSRLQRCELILTNNCNFKCPYCRGIRTDYRKTLTLEEAKNIIDLWAADNLKNLRLSGGEPTVWKGLLDLVSYAKEKGIERIAISSNGSANMSYYERLVEAGVNDFSISLDACCASYGDKMAGGISGAWEKVVANIKELSKLTYVTVGVVVTEETLDKLNETISFADSLGVADIRIIPSAQYNKMLTNAERTPVEICEKYPILKYRIDNIKNGVHVRGIKETDARRCGLVLDDMAIAGDYHFPCIIYMRELGNPIGKVDGNIRKERANWMLQHNCYDDSICRGNCLDVCIEYNNKYTRYKIEQQSLVPSLDSSLFTFEIWSSGSVHDLGIEHFRYDNLELYRDKISEGLIGYCFAEKIPCCPKENHVALMYERNDTRFWFHIRNSEFFELFCRSLVK